VQSCFDFRVDLIAIAGGRGEDRQGDRAARQATAAAQRRADGAGVAAGFVREVERL
jgi:hypothetical protein